MDVVEEHHHAGELLPGLGDAEFAGGLQRVDRIGTGVGQGDHLSSGALRLQHVGREIVAWERMADLADDAAALAFHHLGDVVFHSVAEGIVGGEDVPALAPIGEYGLGRAIGQRVGIVGPVDMVR